MIPAPRLTLTLSTVLTIPALASVAPSSGSTDVLRLIASTTRPNIVVIMADDMRADDLRWMPIVRHRLVERGVSFGNFYASLPLCCPSRASFLTGEYAHNTGVLGNGSSDGFHAFDDSSTLATDLRRAGYQTALVGKYLNGYGEVSPKSSPGADSTRYVPPGWTIWDGAPTVSSGPMRGSVYDYRNTTVNRNGTLVSLRGQYNTRAFGSIADGLITRMSAKNSPFFLDEAYAAPHFGGPTEADDPPAIQSKSPLIKIRTPAVTEQVRDRFDSIIRKPRGHPEIDVSDKPAWVSYMPIPSRRALSAVISTGHCNTSLIRLCRGGRCGPWGLRAVDAGGDRRGVGAFAGRAGGEADCS
jgi:N-acetylglucosamine-6-sulfatase